MAWRTLDVVAAAVAVSAVLVLLGCLAWVARSKRVLGRRLEDLVVRLDEPDAGLEGRHGVERSLVALERATDHAVLRVGEAEAAARRLERALAALPVGVIVFDEQGVSVLANERATQWLRESAVARAAHDLLLPAAAGTSTSRTVDLYSGHHQTLALSVVPVDDAWRGIGAVVLVQDDTERRRLEAVRRDFVANVSHELKTPVGALGLLAETMAAEEDPVVTQRLACRLQDEAARVARVIEDLLDLSRIEAEEAPLREPVQVHLIVGQAAERVRASAATRSVTIDTSGVPRRPAVLGARRQLVSAVVNLLENAVAYSPEGGVVTVETRSDGEWVELTVRDRGPGIAAADLDRIFERFYRIESTPGRDRHGSGLGLAIVRHVVTNHGGEVRVESVEGEGSAFTLRLPAVPLTAAPSIGPETAAETDDPVPSRAGH